MCGRVTEELPAFLLDDIVYCDILVQTRKQRSCLALLRNLKFYEFQRKTVVSSIDLNGTCLAKRKQDIINYKGNRGKWKTPPKDDKLTQPTSSQTMELLESEITFGKFIQQNFNKQKLYLLIKCWDKLIVLQHDIIENEELCIRAEYDDVQSFRIVHGRIKFQAAVEIKHLNGIVLVTNFNDDNDGDKLHTKEKTNQKVMKQENFKQLLERIRSAKTELLVHKSLTQREFTRLQSIQSLGCAELRSPKLEERLLLTRCGDIWMRLTANDDVVVGVPLMNNASADAYTILKNIKPVLKAHSTLSYKYHLFQLHQQFADLESLETFFQTESEIEPEAYSWNAAALAQLVPESFAVLCIKLSLLEVISLQDVPLFIYFDIERVCFSETNTKSTKLFNQQVFIKNLNFSLVLNQRSRYEISFENSTLHQDFLAISMVSEETSIALTFKNDADLVRFEELLIERFHFKKIKRIVGSSSITMADDMDDSQLPLERHARDESFGNKQRFAHSLFYNHQVASMWHGTLALRSLVESDQTSLGESDSIGFKIYWKFYTKTREKAFLFCKMLLDDFVLYKCNVEEVEFPVNKTPKGIQFEHALRNELNYALEVNKDIAVLSNENEETLITSIDQLLQLELQTDLAAQNLV